MKQETKQTNIIYFVFFCFDPYIFPYNHTTLYTHSHKHNQLRLIDRHIFRRLYVSKIIKQYLQCSIKIPLQILTILTSNITLPTSKNDYIIQFIFSKMSL